MIRTQKPSKKFDPDEGKRIHLSDDLGKELSSTLDEIREKQKEHRVEADAQAKGQSYMDLHTFPVSNDALQQLERDFCEKHGVVCFYITTEQIRFGATDPTDSEVIERVKEMEKIHRAEAAVYRISEDSLKFALKRYDSIPKIIEQKSEGIELDEKTLKKYESKIKTLQDLESIISETPISDVLALIMGSALKAGASDIHIEAEAQDIKIRLRIDGVLHDIGALPLEAWGRVISRIKLVAGLKLNIVGQPQDGRFTIYYENDKIEVRTSTVPTSYGESVVMRLLRFSLEALQFEKLGITGYTLAMLQREMAKPNGMIITTGPTGSGKTTTLYAIIHKLNNPETKILTLEDPVEYKLKGINQTQIDTARDFTFAKGLRSLLRQDPDIIMVGEIRDLETADTSINAALTGHLMLSTLHTNSSSGAIPRFLAMGSKSFLLAPAINSIIGQRLARRLCTHCKKAAQPSEEFLNKAREIVEPIKERTDLHTEVSLTDLTSNTFYEPVGCDECNGLGYKGRVGLFEILTMNKDMEAIILSKTVSEYAIQDAAIKNGMITMAQDGMIKAAEGITSLKEIFRQVG